MQCRLFRSLLTDFPTVAFRVSHAKPEKNLTISSSSRIVKLNVRVKFFTGREKLAPWRCN